MHLKKQAAILFLLACTASYASAQDTCTFMTYNVLNFDFTGNGKETYLRTVISEIHPDLLVVQELIDPSGANRFFDSVIHKIDTNYAMGNFINSFDTDNGLYYNKTKFSFLDNTVIKTDIRDINQFRVMHLADSIMLYIYSCHLKASDGTENEILRKLEVDSLMKHTSLLADTSNYILAGDCNMYGSYESAYTTLLNTSLAGYFIDPLQDSLSGTWNNVAYSRFHTQSTRVRSFGGGTTGGLDDRFDMMLFSQAVNNAGGMEYISGSTKAYGNDGDHFNDSINASPNTAVSETIADALHYSSDHIPVLAKFIFPKKNADTPVSVTQEIIYAPLNIYPNPASNHITVTTQQTGDKNILLYNAEGKIMYTTSCTAEIIIPLSGLCAGVYFLEVRSQQYTQHISFIKE